MNENQDLKNLTKLMATFNFLQGKKISFGQIERFLKKSWETGPMLMVSRSKEETDFQERSFSERVRISWNKRCIGHHYSKEHMDELFKKIYTVDSPQGIVKIEGKSYYLFDCGENHNQIFYGIFELQRPVDENILHLFNLFTLNTGKGWSKLDELKKVEDLVHVDDVTGLYNQRKLLKDVENAVERYNEMKEVFTILFIDIDHFKNVNDGFGHLVGTQLLNKMGELLKSTLRESDLIYRYGGDEFVMIIPDVGEETGAIIGDRVLKAIGNHTFKIDATNVQGSKSSEFNLTVSIGVATFPADAKDKEEILGIADKMMYEAKKGGRGRVCNTRDILKEN